MLSERKIVHQPPHYSFRYRGLYANKLNKLFERPQFNIASPSSLFITRMLTLNGRARGFSPAIDSTSTSTRLLGLDIIRTNMSGQTTDLAIPPRPSLDGQDIDHSNDSMVGNAPFRFLDLPGELRTMVYENLLLYGKDSLKCHPQILRTCKEIQKEARSVLYGGKTLTISIHPDRVEIHGKRCGPYNPLARYRHQAKQHDGSYSMTFIRWPEFVSRIWEINITAPSALWFCDSQLPAPVSDRVRRAVINNVLYSLCCALQGYPESGQPRRSVTLDVGIDWSNIARGIPMAFYPLRLIAFAVSPKILHDDGVIRDGLRLRDDTAVHQAAMVRKARFGPKMTMMLLTERIYFEMLKVHPRARWKDKWYSRCRWVRSLVRGFLHYVGLRNECKADRMLDCMIMWARDETVRGSYDRKLELLNELNQVILLDIELRAPQVAWRDCEKGDDAR